jgi:beta-galactosidase
MRPLRFDSLSYLAGDTRVFLISGELHYFRVPHDGWRDRLVKLRAAGGNCAATYVPWLLHEPREGCFDFKTVQYDFERFLDICADLGLWAIVRPGPYQYSELLNGGLPTWLLVDYPDVKARRLDGSLFENSSFSVSYLHPVFLNKTKRWFEQVIPRLAGKQVSRGGPVAAVQIDNELMGIHEWFGSWDYHPESMGVGQEDGRWTNFLRRRYTRLPALNDAWQTAFRSWAEALPIERPQQGFLAEFRRMKDYNDFYFQAAAEYLSTLGGWMRELGIEVPLMHNSGGPGMNAYFEEAVRRMGADFLFGSDHYYNLGLDWGDGTHPTPKYASKVFYSLEMLRHFGKPPTVLEMPGGSAMDFPPILGNDIECAYLTNLAYGMKGYNIYVFAGGANPPGAADPSVGMTFYDYGAGISPSGELRDLYHVQKKIAGMINGHPWLTRARRVADCRLGLVREYARSVHYGMDGREVTVSNNAAWTLMRKGFMMTAFCASMSPEMTDLSAGDWIKDTTTPLMLACADSLEEEIQERLVQFLKNGGKLLIAPRLPSLDEYFNPCTLLAGYLNAEVEHGGVGKPGQVSRPRSAVPVIQDACTRMPIGWEMRLPSGGKAILLERSWVIGRRWDEEMLCQALSLLGWKQAVRCDNPNVWTSLLSDGQHSLLFLINLFTGPLSATVGYLDPASGAWVESGPETVPGISVRIVESPIEQEEVTP